MYGAEALGRFAYAVLIVEFAAQLATLGLKRGLAQQLAQHRQAACLRRVGRAAGRGDRLGAGDGAADRSSRRRCSPTARSHGLEWLLPVDGDRARLVGRHAGRARLSPRRRRDGPRARRSSSRGRSASPPSRWSFISHARRADHRLCAVDGRRADRVGDPVPQKLRPAARLEPATRRRCGGWRGATCRSPPPTRSNGDRAGSTSPSSACSSRRRWSASIMSRRTSPRCRPSSRPASTRSSARSSRRNIAAGNNDGGRQAGAPGRLLGDRRAGRGRAGARHSGRGGDGAGRAGLRRRHRGARPSCSPPKSSRRPPRSAKRR